jgi:hypothetical protein
MSQAAGDAWPRNTTWIANFTCFRHFFPACAEPETSKPGL